MELESIIGNKSRITVLRKLCEFPEKDFSISELAEETRTDKSLISRTIAELEKEKIIISKARRNLKLCQMNKSNNLYKLLLEIFASEKRLNGRRKFSWSA